MEAGRERFWVRESEPGGKLGLGGGCGTGCGSPGQIPTPIPGLSVII